MDENEFLTTKESVLAYRLSKGININNNNSNNNKNNIFEFERGEIKTSFDNRVFKEDQKDLNMNFFNENKDKFINEFSKNNSIVDYRNFCKTINVDWLGKQIPLELYSCSNKEGNEINYYSEILANVFIKSIGPVKTITNIRSLLTPDMIEFYKGKYCLNINEKVNNKYLGMNDICNIVIGAVFYVHFKYYRSIQNYRHRNNEKNKNKNGNKNINESNQKQKNIIKLQSLKKYGFNFNDRNILEFENCYNNLLKENLLKENGLAKPISFYQQHFHIRTTDATILTRNIKKYIKIKKLNEKLH